MIRQTCDGVEQYCASCASRGYAPEDCWWPLTTEFWYRKVAGQARLPRWTHECRACISERNRAARQRPCIDRQAVMA